ncbi:MAG: MMPL family transporter [Actinomycetota bacterium]|nr:MMPL family transporter [Actinomycetota bacterium]
MLAVWSVVFLVAVPFSLRQQDNLTSGGGIAPGSDSAIVDSAADEFPGRDRYQQGVLLEVGPGAGPKALLARVREVKRVMREVDRIELVRLRGAEKRPFVRPRARFMPVAISGNQDNRWDAVKEVREKLGVPDGPKDGITTYFVGQDGLWAALNDLQKEDLAAAEQIGFPITLLILFLTFGALAAAALPVMLGVTSVTLTGAAVYLLSQVTSMSSFVTNAASMIGIGVAVDYSLFVLARYRQEIAAGASPDEARRRALSSSGTAVVFSGLTVMAALLAVFLIDSKLLRSMALGMIVVVAISVMAAISFLPALIDTLGDRAVKRGTLVTRLGNAVRAALRELRGPDRQPAEPFWSRWTHRVMRRPVLSVLAVSALMLALAAPALEIEVGESAIDQFPKDHEARVGLEKGAAIVGPGRLGPVEVLVDFKRGDLDSSRNRRAFDRYVASLRKRRDVTGVEKHAKPKRTDQVLLTVVTKAAPETEESSRLTADLRRQADRGKGLSRVAAVYVGGNTALPEDFASLVSDSMVKLALLIIALTYIVLLLMVRSLLLPLKAVLMTMLSVVSAYGVLVVIFQWGWFDTLFNYDSPGYIEATAPPLMLAVVFGLSMDYEVFLLARIREYVSTDDPRTAVAKGLMVSAATITSAALIMVSVFGAFALVGVPSVKQIGVGLAVAIALDATIVRLILVPATMELLGKWNWWLPAWLEKRLPGAAVEAPAAVASDPGDDVRQLLDRPADRAPGGARAVGVAVRPGDGSPDPVDGGVPASRGGGEGG